MEEKKRHVILIVNPGPVYPIKAMNQKRIHYMLHSLAKDFQVSLATPIHADWELKESNDVLRLISGTFHNLGSNKPKSNVLRKRFSQLLEYFAYYMGGFDREYISYGYFQDHVEQLIKEYDYKIVISNYWEGSRFFLKADQSVYKILDPHYAVEENLEVFQNTPITGLKRFFERRRLKKNAIIEKKILSASDMALPLSERNMEEFKKITPDKTMLLVADGCDIDHFTSWPIDPDPYTILFYGSMGSRQNIEAFWRFFRNIYKRLKINIPELKVLVVGAGPPEEIVRLNNGNDIIITGFVEDVRPWLAKAWLNILPLDYGSGFRGRVVELMAMGIPVVGTHNALDSIGMESGKGGFIGNSDEELYEYCLRLLEDHHLRNEVSTNCVEFVKQNFSLDSTFGKLNRFLKDKINLE